MGEKRNTQKQENVIGLIRGVKVIALLYQSVFYRCLLYFGLNRL